jgi:predicted nucleic-acid-binding Zn-ribbon protein
MHQFVKNETISYLNRIFSKCKKGVAMTGTGLSKMFDVQNNQFIVVYCNSCGYSEFYNKRSSTASNILDLFFGG